MDCPTTSTNQATNGIINHSYTHINVYLIKHHSYSHQCIHAQSAARRDIISRVHFTHFIRLYIHALKNPKWRQYLLLPAFELLPFHFHINFQFKMLKKQMKKMKNEFRRRQFYAPFFPAQRAEMTTSDRIKGFLAPYCSLESILFHISLFSRYSAFGINSVLD